MPGRRRRSGLGEWREPAVAFEEYGQGFDLADAVFGGGGQVGVDGGELGQPLQGAPGACGVPKPRRGLTWRF